MKKLLVSSMLLFTMSGGVKSQDLPILGEIWKGDFNFTHKVYVPKYGMVNKVNFSDKDYLFTLGLDKANKIIFISTVDKKFKIKNISYIGRELKSLANEVKPKLIMGWGHYLPLDEGWNAAFDFKNINDNSKVLFLFKMLE